MGQCLSCINEDYGQVIPTAPPEHFGPSTSISPHTSAHLPYVVPPLTDIPSIDIVTLPAITRLDHPHVMHHPSYKVLRLATWNLQLFTPEKASNVGVQEVICLTILENFISLLVIQEVTSPSALEKICQELNSPSLPAVRQCKQQLGLSQQRWRTYSSCQSLGRLTRGYVEYGTILINETIFGESLPIEVAATSLLESTKRSDSVKKSFCRSPFLCHIKLGSEMKIILTSVHLKATGLGKQDEDRTIEEVLSLSKLLEAAEQCSLTAMPFILCGDFNLKPSHDAFNEFHSRHQFVNLLSDGTNISAVNPRGNYCYDNIWWNAENSVTRGNGFYFSGYCGVIRDGLRHPLIHSQSGDFGYNSFISDHCPVWADFIVNSSDERI